METTPVVSFVDEIPVMAWTEHGQELVTVQLKRFGKVNVKIVSDKIKAVGKAKTNTQQQFKYRGIEDVMNALASPLDDAGITISPLFAIPVEIRYYKISDKDWCYKEFFLVFRIEDKDGNFQDVSVIAGAADNGDKITGKIYSYGFKNMANCLFNIPYSDDPDATSPPAAVKSQKTAVDNYVDNQKAFPKDAKWLDDTKELYAAKTVAEFRVALGKCLAAQLKINSSTKDKLNEHLATLK